MQFLIHLERNMTKIKCIILSMVVGKSAIVVKKKPKKIAKLFQ